MLIDTIDLDLKNAMKERNEVKVSTLRMLKAALTNKLIERKEKALSDDITTEVIQKQAKQRKESIEEFRKGSRQDLIEKETKELAILEKYLPKQLDETELKALIQKAIQSTGAKTKADIGKIMKELMPQVKGKADGKEINRIAGSFLL